MVIPIAFFAFVFLFGSLINAALHFSPTKSAAWLASLFTLQSVPLRGTSGRLSGPLREHQDSDLRRVFATFDHDGDGFITPKELKDSLETLGLFVSDHDLSSMIDKMDANGDGTIDLQEFCSLYESMGGRAGGNDEKGKIDAADGELREAFDVFDKNGDGFITVEELGSVLSSLGLRKGFRLEECKEMIRKVDLDGDGRVNFEEFQTMMETGGFFTR